MTCHLSGAHALQYLSYHRLSARIRHHLNQTASLESQTQSTILQQLLDPDPSRFLSRVRIQYGNEVLQRHPGKGGKGETLSGPEVGVKNVHDGKACLQVGK